jgi:glycosyltransferase involved in cell wall biosynthesis
VAAAQLLIMPSLYESLSIVLLEAWSVGVPVLVNGRSQVLHGQCVRSGAGLEYTDYESFKKALIGLAKQPSLGREMGERGRQFVHDSYAWPVVERKYLEWAEWICREAA